MQNLVIFVQLRYIGRKDEDVQHNVYVRILQSLEYYDAGQTNIGTWVFSIARNQCSSHNYYRKKRQRESEEPLLFCQVEDSNHLAYLERDVVERFFESHHRIMIDPSEDYYDEFVELDSENLLKKALLWEVISSKGRLVNQNN